MGILSRQLFAVAIALGTAVAIVSAPPEAQAQTKEQQVKATLVFHFAKQCKWPAKAFPSADAPFTIGILGGDPFGGALDGVVKGESASGHGIVVRRVGSVDELRNCQIAVIRGGSAAGAAASLAGSPVLTVSDSGQFAKQGGMVDLVSSGGTVGYELNTDAAKRAGIQIHPNLLKLGKLVSN